MKEAAAVLAGRRLSPPPARPPAVGKKRAGRRRTLCKCCGWREMRASRVFQSSRSYIHHRFRRVASQPFIWKSTVAMQRKPRGLVSAQAGGVAGLLWRPSRWFLGLEPRRLRADGRGPAICCWVVSVHREQCNLPFKF
jgi:hypothetical protein